MDKKIYDINGEVMSFKARNHHKDIIKTRSKLKLVTRVKYTILFLITAMVFTYGYTIANKVNEYITDVQDTNMQLQKKVESLEKYQSMYNSEKLKNISMAENFEDVVEETDKSIKQLKKDNIKLAKSNKALVKKYNNVVDRLKTYEKYRYAVIDESGLRTDLTYDQIKLGEELMKKKGYDPNILFAIGMVESGFNESETSTLSTAKGYTQFLDGTAQYTWETLLHNGKGSWYPSLALDGSNNIRMCVAYFDYLMEKHGNFYKAMGQYCGAGTKQGSFTYTYIDRMNRHAMRSGVNIYDIINKMN